MASYVDVVKQWATYYVRHVDTTQNVVGNYSTLTFKAYLSVNSKSGISWTRGSATLHFTTLPLAKQYNKGVYEIGTVSVDIGHEADGTFPGFTMGGSINTTYMMVGNCSYTLGRGEVATIPRASTISAVNFTNFWNGFNVTYTKYYAGFTCKLRVSYPAVSIIQTFDNYGSGSYIAFSSANQDAIMKKLISSGSAQLGFVIETWNGGTKIGESLESVITISKPTVNQIANVSNFDVDVGFTIGLSRTYPLYTSRLDVIVSGTNVYSSMISDNQKVTFSSSQLNTIYNLMKTMNSANFTLQITSLYGTLTAGNISVEKVGNITNATPTLPGFSWQTINNLTLHDNQTIIKGRSNVKVTIQQATAYKGATISYYQVTIGSVTSKVTTLETTLNNCDSDVIVVYAVDTRGNAINKQMICSKYIKYEPITFEALDYERGSGGIGSDVTIEFNGTMLDVNFGLQKNNLTATYFFKEASAKDYTQGTTNITPVVNSKYSNIVAIRGDLGANGFTIDKNFNLKVTISDKLTAVTREIVIAKGVPTMAIHEDGVAFGSFYDEKIGGALQATDITVAGNKVSGVLGFKYTLGPNVNLNTLTQEGYYQQNATANTSTSLNYPVVEAGLLTVINRACIYQTYQTFNSSGFFYRSCYNGTWYPWKKAISGDANVVAHLTAKGGYLGFDVATGGYLRTPPNGLLPNVKGSNGYIGDPSWRFKKGYFETIETNNFFRSIGNTGWYNDTYGGGIYMEDEEYVRVYNNKHFLTFGNVVANNFISSTNGSAHALWVYGLSFGDINGIQWGNQNYTYIHVWSNVGSYGINVWASDKRLKEHIHDTEVNHALEKIDQIQHVKFDWKSGGNCELGYVADDLEEVLPCLIHEVEQQEDEETGIKPKPLKHINHTTLTPLITMGMQELIQENKYLWEFNNAVVDEVCILKERIEKLENLVTKLLEENIERDEENGTYEYVI